MTTEIAIDPAPEAVTETSPPVVETAPLTPAAPPPAPAPKTKRVAKTQEPARMADEQNGTPSAMPSQSTVPAEILAELSALRAEKDARAKTDEETKASLAKLQDALALTAKEKAELTEAHRRTKIDTAVRLAAMEAGAIDPDDVTTLLAGRFTFDEKGGVILADETKAKAIDAVKSFLEKKPHLAGRKVAGGSGASPFPAQSAPTSMQKFDISSNEGLTQLSRSLTHPRKP
jgi:hypothetical protein